MTCYTHLNTLLASALSVVLLANGVHSQEQVPASDFFTAAAFKDVELASQDAGIVKKLLVKEGSNIDSQQPIVELNRKLYEFEADRALAEFKIADLEKSSNADLKYARRSAEFNSVLVERLTAAIDSFEKSVSKTEKEQAELELKKARLSIRQARLQQQVAKEKSKSRKAEQLTADQRLQLRTVKSPLSGSVVEILVEEGEWVQAGQPIARIVNYDKLKIKGYVPAEIFSVDDVGKKLYFQAVKPRITGDPKLEATITFVSPEIEPKFFATPKVRIIAEMDNPERKIRINSEMRLAQ